uniref:Uncharacterized protein n=1 Tax=Romanomermis culicivorax TaxID=13658 RepID=A0A915J6Y6_ROMCU
MLLNSNRQSLLYSALENYDKHKQIIFLAFTNIVYIQSGIILTGYLAISGIKNPEKLKPGAPNPVACLVDCAHWVRDKERKARNFSQYDTGKKMCSMRAVIAKCCAGIAV